MARVQVEVEVFSVRVRKKSALLTRVETQKEKGLTGRTGWVYCVGDWYKF